MSDHDLFGRLDHIGVVVKDISTAKSFYGSLGVKSFEKSGTPGKNKTFHGEPLIGGKTEMQMGRIGEIGIQLTQPIVPPSMAFAFLEEVGEGVNHLAYIVDDIEEVTRLMVAAGYEIIFSSEYLDGGGEIYVNTGHNWCIQLFEPSKES